MKRTLTLLQKRLVTGLLLLAPLVGAGWLVYWLVTSVDGLFPVALRPHVGGRPVPGLGLLAVVVLAFLVGLFTHNFIGRRLLAGFDALAQKIPVFGTTYGLLKQVLESVFSSGGGSFKSAVLVEYPTPGSWAIAFVAQPLVVGKLQEATSAVVMAVYVPTTPNPTSGFFLLVDRARVRPLDMTVEQAFKALLTMGIADAPGEVLATTAKWSREEYGKARTRPG